MTEAIPSKEWKIGRDIVLEMAPDVERLREMGLKEVNEIKQIIQNMRDRLQRFVETIGPLNAHNERFRELMGHDARQSLGGIQSMILDDWLREKSFGRLESYDEIVDKFLVGQEYPEQFTKEFCDELCRLGVEFCNQDNNELSAEFRAVLEDLDEREMSPIYLEDLDVLTDLRGKFEGEELENAVRRVLDCFPQDSWDNLRSMFVDFLDSGLDVEDVPEELEEKLKVFGLEDYLKLCKDLLKAEAKKVDARVHLIVIHSKVMAAAFGSMQFWVEGESLEGEEISAGKFLDDLGLLCADKCGKLDFRVSKELSDDPALLIHEPTVTNLVLNMIQNAQKHGEARQFAINSYVEGDNLEISISDSGSGIDAEIVEHIFEDGYSAGDGTGLGLASARERLAQFGASVSCEGHGGIEGGAKFVISLKLAA